jgi:hypothetical protein
MIGVETVHVFQWVAVAQLFSRRYNSYFHHLAALLSTLGRSPFLDPAATPSARPYFAALGYSDSLTADFLLLGVFLLIAAFLFAVLSAWKYFSEIHTRAATWVYDIALFPLAVGFSANIFLTLANRGFASAEANCALLFGAICVTALVFARSCRALFVSPPKPFAFGKFRYSIAVPATVRPAAFECSETYLGAYVFLEGAWLLLVGLCLFSLMPFALEAGALLALVRALLLCGSDFYAASLHKVGLLFNHATIIYTYAWLIV